MDGIVEDIAEIWGKVIGYLEEGGAPQDRGAGVISWGGVLCSRR